MGVEIGMDPSTTALLIFWGVLFFHPLPDVASENIFCTAGVSSVCGIIPIAAIFGFFGGGKTETYMMVRKLDNFCSKILLLV